MNLNQQQFKHCQNYGCLQCHRCYFISLGKKKQLYSAFEKVQKTCFSTIWQLQWPFRSIFLSLFALTTCMQSIAEEEQLHEKLLKTRKFDWWLYFKFLSPAILQQYLRKELSELIFCKQNATVIHMCKVIVPPALKTHY